MELDGKRIQALFSELSLEDRTRLPRFEKLWTQTTRPAPRFRRSWAVTAAVVVIVAASSFALWSKLSQTMLNIAPLEIPAPQLAKVIEPSQPQPPHQKKPIRRRQTNSVSLSEAALLSRWQSPTQNFMQSPSSVSFNSLPQLNQSAKELESFLPKKESNQ